MIIIDIAQAFALARELGIEYADIKGDIESQMRLLGGRINGRMPRNVQFHTAKIEKPEFAGACLAFCGTGKAPEILQKYDTGGELND